MSSADIYQYEAEVGSKVGFPTCFPLEVIWESGGEVIQWSVPGKSPSLPERYPQAQNLALVHVVASVFDGRIDMRSAGIATAKRFNRGPGAGGAAGSML